MEPGVLGRCFLVVRRVFVYFFGCFAESVSADASPLVSRVPRWVFVVGLELNLEARPGCVVYSVSALLLE